MFLCVMGSHCDGMFGGVHDGIDDELGVPTRELFGDKVWTSWNEVFDEIFDEIGVGSWSFISFLWDFGDLQTPTLVGTCLPIWSCFPRRSSLALPCHFSAIFGATEVPLSWATWPLKVKCFAKALERF